MKKEWWHKGFLSYLWDWLSYYESDDHPLRMLPVFYTIPMIVHAIRKDPAPVHVMHL